MLSKLTIRSPDSSNLSIKYSTCVLVSLGWAFANGFILFLALKYTCGVRVSKEQEEKGLDQVYHDTDAYPGRVFEEIA